MASKRNLGSSAEALGALFRGENSEEAEVGGLVVADAIDCLRTVRDFLTKKPKGKRG